MTNKKNFLLFFSILFFSVLTAPFLGNLYENYFGPVSSGFWGPQNPQYLEGFTFGFVFFASFLSWVFVEREKRIKYWLSYSIPVLVILLLAGLLEQLIIGILFVSIGWIIGQGVVIFIQRNKKN